MTRFMDAVGYLLELRDEKNMDWFSFACDKAISSAGGSLTDPELEFMWELLTKTDASYNSEVQTSLAIVPEEGAVEGQGEHAFLESLGAFHNFKGLSSGLRLNLTKQVTIVFGRNGSGKSSLCECFRILSNSEVPETPTKNVRYDQAGTPSFDYKLRSSEKKTWERSVGYGVYGGEIKYYDARVALRYITESLQPERIVKIAPFRLEVFNFAASIMTQFKGYISEKTSVLKQELQRQIETIQAQNPSPPGHRRTVTRNQISYQ